MSGMSRHFFCIMPHSENLDIQHIRVYNYPMNLKNCYIRTLAGMFLLLLSSSLFSCASNTAVSGNPSPKTDVQAAQVDKSPELNPNTIDFIPDAEHVKYLGRSFFMDDKLLMCYSSTGAEFNVKAKRLDVTIIGDNRVSGSDNGSAARIVAFVNGERKLDTMILSKSKDYTIFNGEELIEGEVRIIKVSEATSSLAAISKITVDEDGTISPTAPRDLKIEFIGDSITCGYGVDDLDRNHHFKTSTEDNSKTYAYKTAANLDADYSMVSVSGWGIISGYSGDGTKQASSQLPKYYDRLAVSWSTIAAVDPKAVRWDFSSFVPDFIVINLGTNDASYTKGDSKKITEYKDAYIAFLKDIRSKNPDAHIICSLGIMGQDLCPAIENAVSEYQTETGDSKVTPLKFANQNMSDGIAADWHPSEKTHANAAALLTAKIKELMNN